MSCRFSYRTVVPTCSWGLRCALLGSIATCRLAVNAAIEGNSISLPQVGDAELRILSPTILELNLVSTKEPDPAQPTEWNFVDANHNLQLPPATEFEVTAGTNKLSISTLGFKRRPLYAPLRSRDLRIENSLFVVLSSPVANGQTLSVKNPSGTYWGPETSFSAVVDPFRFN